MNGRSSVTNPFELTEEDRFRQAVARRAHERTTDRWKGRSPYRPYTEEPADVIRETEKLYVARIHAAREVAARAWHGCPMSTAYYDYMERVNTATTVDQIEAIVCET